jgi:hypothetical protein
VTLTIVAIAAGTFFGLFYNFWGLIPLTVSAAVVSWVSAWLAGQDASAQLLAVVVTSFALQSGYMIGLSARSQFGRILSRRDETRRAKRV